MLGRMGVRFWREADVSSKTCNSRTCEQGGPARPSQPRVHRFAACAIGLPKPANPMPAAPLSPTSPVGILAGE